MISPPTKASKIAVTSILSFILFALTGVGLAFGDFELQAEANVPAPIVLDGIVTESNAAVLLLSGQEALDAIGDDISVVAASNNVSVAALVAEFQRDPNISADTANNVLYVDKGGLEPSGGDAQPSGANTSDLGFQPTFSEVFSLNSNPGAPITLYLDFNGHTTSGTFWNQWSGIENIVSPPFSLDSDLANFSNDELANIYIAWQAAAEDFASFEVNVSTVEPPQDDLLRNSGTGNRYGIRTIITNDPFSCSCGGLAYINRFGYDEPAFVFNKSAQTTGETISHEIGHSLGLTHDGSADSDYYSGHGGASNPDSWAPIMGASFFTGYSQWDSGTYAGANNSGSSGNMERGADDLAVIVSAPNGLEYRVDDHGPVHSQSTALTGSDDLTGVGIIERTNDDDWFSFALTASDTVDLDVTVDNIRPNLNAAVSLHDINGVLLHASDYETRGATIHDVALDAGTYFVRVTSEGAEHYDRYATIGSYELTVASSPPAITTITLATTTTTTAPTTTTTTAPTTTSEPVDPTPPPITCAGLDATIVGTPGADNIVGTSGDDIIASRGGDDIIDSGAGNDIICSGPGHDTVSSGSGDDVVYAGGGRDRVTGGTGNDRLLGGSGNDKLFGQDGNDKLSGMGGDDEIHGGDGRDVIRGNAGHDLIYGDAGNDTLLGGIGRDLMYGGADSDLMRGHGAADKMFGNSGNDRMYGGFGIDTMNGGTGTDFGDGMSGRDRGFEFETRRRFAN